jgi:uncharacterized membrane protein/mono/diheme cytochrome c family protein
MRARFGLLFSLCIATLIAGEALGAVAGDDVEKPVKAPKAEPVDKVAITQKVHDIFEAKCLDCHGPELPRPKGKFGYVLDLKRVAANPDYIVPGKPDESDLYKMVFHDEMPGEDANVPPLTPAEKDAVKQWIELGAPGDLPGGGEVHAAVAQTENAKPPEPIWRHLLRWIGLFHPVSTHFPVALMFVAVFAEGLAWWTKRESWAHTVRFLVVIAALGAIGAVGLGWLNAYFSSYNKAPGALLWWHRWLGTASGVWSVICAGLVLLSDPTEGGMARKRLRGALFAGAVLVGVAGFLGSALIYGLDHYAWK